MTFGGGSAPALAATPCNLGNICLNEDINFLGGYLNYTASDPNYTNNYFQVTGHNVNDRVSSLRNYNCTPVKFFRDADYVDIEFQMQNGSGYNMSSLGAQNDILSSHLRTSSC